jgi:hypothetical protein
MSNPHEWQNPENILDWCDYCHCGILIGESYTIDKDGKKYHPDCYQQKNCYFDSFEMNGKEE